MATPTQTITLTPAELRKAEKAAKSRGVTIMEYLRERDRPRVETRPFTVRLPVTVIAELQKKADKKAGHANAPLGPYVQELIQQAL